MFDATTSKDKPRAASQAVNTNKIIKTMLARIICFVSIIIDIRINKDNVIPSKHGRDDIIWD